MFPEAPDEQTPIVLRGRIEYDGHERYLPRVLREGGDELVLRYEQAVATEDHDYEPILVLFNPLTLLGFPSGTTEVTVVGTLEILDRGKEIGTYTARYVFGKTRTVYSTRDLSDPRRQGLIAVRDRIEDQVRGDAANLGAYIDVGAGTPQEGKEK